VADTITFTAANPDLQGQAIVYVGISATLILTLINNSGAAIPLSSQTSPSTLTFFPPRFYTTEQVQAMKVSASNWSATLSGKSWVIGFTGADGPWENGASIVIQVAQAISTAQPTSGFAQINPKNMGATAPPQISAGITLNDPPEPGNADLGETLSVSLEGQGVVYVSSDKDPLPNTLFLNLKNVGDAPIYDGPPEEVGNPRVNISFVYGSTAGALATNDDPNAHPEGSAWKITAEALVNIDWQALTPTYSAESPNPVWGLKPTNTNHVIIGTGDAANVSFSFSNILSFTPPGHTQMVVQCTGFKQTGKRRYNDHTFVVDISKQVAPPTRGLVYFFGGKPLYTVFDPNTTTDVQLQWAMFNVPSVLLLTNIPQIAPLPINYPKFAPIGYDGTTITIPGVRENTAVFITLQAFDGKGNYLNSAQFVAFIRAYMFLDPRDDQVYPAILVGKTLWMAHNLNYAAKNSRPYNDDPANAAQYGRLYSWAAADDKPKGWRLPQESDWKALIVAFGSPGDAYAALIAAGTSGFNAQLGGEQDAGKFAGLTSFGYYWTATPGAKTGQSSAASNYGYVQFNKTKSSVTTGATFPAEFGISVRYVRDLL
jgi:uncharacterized protein (TIGR02145 family)